MKQMLFPELPPELLVLRPEPRPKLYGSPAALGYSQQFPALIGATACPFSNWLYLLAVKLYRPPVTCGFSTATITGDQSKCCGWECQHGSRCLSSALSVQLNDDLVPIFKVKDANDNDLFPQPMGSTVTVFMDDACAGVRKYFFTRTMQEAMVLTCDPQFIGYGAVRFTIDQPLLDAITACPSKKGFFGLEWHG